MNSQKRQRGVILSPEGLQKLQDARLKLEAQENFGQRFTFEKLSELTRLDIHTITRMLNCKQGVDKRTLERFFIAFNLELRESYYSNPYTIHRQDWGQAPYISDFYGRSSELATLEQLILKKRCRLVALVGMGGVGKTALSIKLAREIQDQFEYVIWRSLRDAPQLKDLLSGILQVFRNEQRIDTDLPKSLTQLKLQLIDNLRQYRCLLILDNAESLLRSGNQIGEYREGCEGYGDLLRLLGETTHQSCLMLTSREKPKEVALLEGEALPVRSLKLGGLKAVDAQEIFKLKGISTVEEQWSTITERYAGNPLALKIVATTIQDVFDGSKVCEFLRQDMTVFGDIRKILDQQFERLSDLEKDIMYWLAINRESIDISELQEDIVSPIPQLKLVEALESLGRRSLVEKKNALFTLQPVVMEYVTQQLIERVCKEIVTSNINLFKCYSLMKATAKDYVRETQINLILKPVIDGLLNVFKNKKLIENQLTQIIVKQRETSLLEQSYTIGNIVNLFCQLETNLNGYDFSHLTVWQADLRRVNLHNTNFSYANVDKSMC